MLMIGVHLFLSPCVVLISSRVVLCGRRRRAFALDITSSTLFVPVLFDLPDRMCDALPPPHTHTHPPPHIHLRPTPSSAPSLFQSNPTHGEHEIDMPATTFNLCFVFVCDVLPGGGPMLDIAMSSPRSESATAVRSGPRSRSRSRSRTPEPPRGAVSAEYATVTVSSPPGRDASQTSPAPAPSPHPPELRTRSIVPVERCLVVQMPAITSKASTTFWDMI